MVPDFGFVDHSEETLNAMILIYKTNSKIIISEFMVSNPQLLGKERGLAIKRLIKAVYAWCDELGLYAFNLCDDNRVRKVLEGFGTKVGYTGLDLMVYKGEKTCHQEQ